jgi:hypothetical protein
LAPIECPQARPLKWRTYEGEQSGFPNLNCGVDFETFSDFTRIESEYYADLASDYTETIEKWDEVRLAELSVEP